MGYLLFLDLRSSLAMATAFLEMNMFADFSACVGSTKNDRRDVLSIALSLKTRISNFCLAPWP